jgi:hypothetical protein
MNSDRKFSLDHDDGYFEKIKRDINFSNKIELLRGKYRINISKFISEIDIDVWKRKVINQKSYPQIKNDLLSVMKKFNIKTSYYLVLEMYFFSNYSDYFFNSRPNYFACDFELVDTKSKSRSDMSKLWNRNSSKYIRIYLDSKVSKPNLISFINERWKEIEFKLGKDKSKRYIKRRSDSNLKRNREILKLNKLAKDKLNGLFEEIFGREPIRGTYRSEIISQIVKKWGYEIESSGVDKVLYREQNKEDK